MKLYRIKKQLNVEQEPIKGDLIKVSRMIEYINDGGDNITSSVFNKYRERLLGKGIISTSDNREGMIWLPLPQFGEFVRLYNMD